MDDEIEPIGDEGASDDVEPVTGDDVGLVDTSESVDGGDQGGGDTVEPDGDADDSEQSDDGEIQLFEDGDGFAVVGKPGAVERFRRASAEWSEAKELDLTRLHKLLAKGSEALELASEISASSGFWIKLTPESAQRYRDEGLMDTKTPGIKHVMIGVPGEIAKWLQAEDGPRTIFTNPAVLSGVAGLMAQAAQQQGAAQIIAQLEVMNSKLDDALRKQDDAATAPLFGVAAAVERAWTIRDVTGGVNEVTWGTIDSGSQTIGATQKYALDQLEAVGKKLEENSKVAGLAKAARQSVPEVQKWLAVLLQCAEMQGRLDVLELDRVFVVLPDQLDKYRIGLRTDRMRRMQLIVDCTEPLLERIDAACGSANARILREWTRAREVIEAGNEIAAEIQSVHKVLGIESSGRSWEPRQLERAAEVGARAIQQVREKGPGAAVVLLGIAAKLVADQRKGDSTPPS